MIARTATPALERLRRIARRLRRPARLLARAAAVALAVVLLIAGAAAAALRAQFTGTPAVWAKTSGHDALWLGHAWVDGRRTEADVAALAVRLRATGIRDVYVHSGPYGWDGALSPTKYPNAGNFLKWWRKHLPDVRVSAWLGQAVKNGLDLGDPAARRRVVAGAADLTRLGYDGIHYDFEPVNDGDPNLLAVLRATRTAIGPDRPLSVATHQIEPLSGVRHPLRLVMGHDKYWTTAYFRQVADLVDQVAIMTYDSFLPFESLYGGHVVRQATLALENLPPHKTILIGAPAYHDHGWSRLDASESVAVAAEGARLALTDHGSPRERFGLAPYVDFAATEQDWREYQQSWVSPR
ncbi:hypothetical protein AB0K60_11660 [Thermopolyspora sp. NPDC052614]|uniref:hypothetical protein n=1 Tax=Thermopolyspora sp. NPDC052614 TaxID=3155682 RepID=UPI003436D0DD